MALVYSYTGLNMIDPAVWYGTVTYASSSELVIQNGASVADYHGYGVTYDAYGPVSGTVTSYEEYYNGSLIGGVSNITVPATVVDYYLDRGDFNGLFGYALTGNDTIQGSVYNDRIATFGGNDTIYLGGGSDYVDGGTGLDTVVLS